MSGHEIGRSFVVAERSLAEVVDALPGYTAVVNDPPWTAVAPRLRPPMAVVLAGSMERRHLDAVAGRARGAGPIVGIGGGTALDTAKYLAWRAGRPLVQVPTITSVDAAFTDAVGLRDEGRVRYVGHVVPELVVLDLPLIRTAPASLNRAGIGDVLSCHTGLFDWQIAVRAGAGPPWDEGLAALGRELLAGLDRATADVAAVTDDGIRFLADAYRRIGAACAFAGHSRFEEGSEHFFAYAFEARTRRQLIHGELVALSVCAMSHIQGNDPEWARSIVTAAGARAHPSDLGIDEADFTATVLDLPAYADREQLGVTIADLGPLTPALARSAWSFVSTLPRVGAT